LDGADLHVSFTHIAGFLVVLVGYLVAGGLVAYLIGDATAPRHAIAYGLGWHGLVGGLLKVEPSADNKR
jgi:uncharacterized membrane protein YbjE (DUF340 family)